MVAAELRKPLRVLSAELADGSRPLKTLQK